MRGEDGLLGPRTAVRTFTGAQQINLQAGVASSLNGASELWLIGLAKRGDDATGDSRTICTLNTGSITLMDLGISSTDLWRCGGRSRSSDSYQAAYSAGNTDTDWHLLAGRLKFASPKIIELYLDGNLIASTTPTGWTTSLAASTSTYGDGIGYYRSDSGNGSQYFDGWINDVIVKAGALPAGSLGALTAAVQSLQRVASGTVSRGDPAEPAERRILLIGSDTQLVVAAATSDSATGEYSTDVFGDTTVYGLSFVDYGQPPRRSQAYSLDARCWVGAPAPLGHWYECEQAGTTGSTEPTWPTDGSTVTDGTVIWRDKGVMERPWAEGPYLAEAA
jgi:hypothetical protein